jgi:2'-5' RNA ligase
VELNRTLLFVCDQASRHRLLANTCGVGAQFFSQNHRRFCAAIRWAVFEPHVTFQIGADRADSARQALAESARECTPINLKPLGIQQSDEFVKTLFVQFALSAELRQMNEIIRDAAQDSSQYQLQPHLSLLYKNMEAAARRELAASIVVPFSEITFERIKAVRCVSPTQSRADVEAWRVIAAEELSR